MCRFSDGGYSPNWKETADLTMGGFCLLPFFAKSDDTNENQH
jgi:hypothetical protein